MKHLKDPKKDWIKINRALDDHWIWNTGEPFTKGQAWIDMLMLAYHSDDEKVINGHVRKVKRGQIPYSKLFLANRWKWSMGKLTRFLRVLEVNGMCSVFSRTDGTTITIENYEFWQSGRKTDGQTNGKQTENKRKTNGNRKEDIKKNKEKKEECISTNPFFHPSLQDISEYVESMNYGIDPQAFYDYYEDHDWKKKNGQPIKNWKASVRAWNDREQIWQKDRTAPVNETKTIHYPEFKKEEYEDPNYGETMPDYLKETVKRLKGGGGHE